MVNGQSNKSIHEDAVTLFLTTLSSVSIPGFISRAESGVLIAVNDPWSRLTGYLPQEAMGKSTIELGIWAQPEDRNLKLSGQLQSSNNFSVSTVGKHKSGKHFYTEITINAFLVNGERLLFGFAKNGDGQSQLVENLLEELHFFKELTTHSPAVLFQFKAEEHRPGYFTYMTKAVQEISGVPPSAITKDPSLAFKHVHLDDLEPMREEFRRSKATLTNWSLDFRILHLSGEACWVHGEGIPRRSPDGSTTWFGSWIDISQQKKAQQSVELAQLAEAKKSRDLEITLDNMEQGLLRLASDGEILIYNRRLIELLEITEEEIMSFRNAGDLVRFQTERGDFGKDYQWVSPEAQAVLRGGDPNVTPDRYTRKARNGRVIEVKNKQLPDGSMVRTFSDITDYVLAQAKLQANNDRFRNLASLTSDWFWENDSQLRFTWMEGNTPHSGRFADQSAYIGKSPQETLAGLLTTEQFANHLRVVEARKPFADLEFQIKDPQGVPQVYVIKGAPFFDGAGVYQGYRGVGQRITEQRRQQSEYLRLANFDPLTKLPNRRLLMDRLGRALLSSERTRSFGALIFLDLDNFKSLNDTLGHDAGDLLLTEVAERLAHCVRDSDTVCRFGGDEFVIILEHLGSEPEFAAELATQVAKKVLLALSDRHVIRGRTIFSSSSLGLTTFNGRGADVDELLKQADLAMYKAKDAGRNTLRFFDPNMQIAVDERAMMETDLRLGLERGEFLLYFQPVVSHHGIVTSVEALIRWNCPKRGLVGPANFIPLAEQSGLILLIGHWVMQTVCQQLVAWQSEPAKASLSIAMNVSAREFHGPDFVNNVLSVLETTGACPDRLKLELTENLVVSDIHEAIEKMTALRKRGVRFSLDDFGTGNSSLSYLKKLPLDELKIDQSFVRDLMTNESDAAITTTIVALAHSLGLNVVAEGVETDAQRKFLIEKGCESLQGYAFGKPLPVGQISFDSFEKAFEKTNPVELR